MGSFARRLRPDDQGEPGVKALPEEPALVPSNYLGEKKPSLRFQPRLRRSGKSDNSLAPA